MFTAWISLLIFARLDLIRYGQEAAHKQKLLLETHAPMVQWSSGYVWLYDDVTVVRQM